MTTARMPGISCIACAGHQLDLGTCTCLLASWHPDTLAAAWLLEGKRPKQMSSSVTLVCGAVWGKPLPVLCRRSHALTA